MKYLLSIDYDECDTKSYRGVVINDIENGKIVELIRVNTGNIKLDEETALDELFEVIDKDEYDIDYMSSYDHYFMDFDYENDLIYRADVDAMQKEQDEKIKMYKIEIEKGEAEDLTMEEFNYIINRRDVKDE